MTANLKIIRTLTDMFPNLDTELIDEIVLQKQGR